MLTSAVCCMPGMPYELPGSRACLHSRINAFNSASDGLVSSLVRRARSWASISRSLHGQQVALHAAAATSLSVHEPNPCSTSSCTAAHAQARGYTFGHLELGVARCFSRECCCIAVAMCPESAALMTFVASPLSQLSCLPLRTYIVLFQGLLLLLVVLVSISLLTSNCHCTAACLRQNRLWLSSYTSGAGMRCSSAAGCHDSAALNVACVKTSPAAV